jgi:ADP-ribose pyrophosphatase YjhB (NUDIX family)
MILQVGVKIFLRNPDGKYLLMRRSPEKYPGVKGAWDIPGGRINPGSLLMENLRREVMEETQLEIISEPKLIYAQDIIPNDEKHVVRLSYVGETRGEPILDISENVEYEWLSLDELKNHKNVDIYAQKIINSGVLDKYL